MFGLEKDRKPKEKKPGFQFDLEKDLKDPQKRNECVKHIEGQITKIKNHLQKGSKKQDFDQLGILLNGYQALVIVLGKAAAAATATK